MTDEVNGEIVEPRCDILRETYHDVTVHHETETVEADLFAELRDLSRGGYTGGSYAWVVRDPAEAIADGLESPESEAVRAAVSETVAALCAEFPIYD